MTIQPTYAELVANREATYIAQRDAEEITNQIKTALAAAIWAEPEHKNDTARKAELVIRLRDYEADFDNTQRAADAYRAALAAIEVYQEAAKDARAKLRHETAQLELRAAELQLQAAQARHDAQEPTDEDPWGCLTNGQRHITIDKHAIADGMPVGVSESAAWEKYTIAEITTSDQSGEWLGWAVLDGDMPKKALDSEGQFFVFSEHGDAEDHHMALCRLSKDEWSIVAIYKELPF